MIVFTSILQLCNEIIKYRDVRLAPKNYAFIEFSDEFKAGAALAGLNGVDIGDCTLQLTYAKKW